MIEKFMRNLTKSARKKKEYEKVTKKSKKDVEKIGPPPGVIKP